METRVIRNDRYVKRVWNRKTKKVYSQGKRVSKNDPLGYDARRIYVKSGMIALAKYLKDTNDWTLYQTVEFLRKIGIIKPREN